MGGGAYCIPNIWEFVCQGVLFLMMARQEVSVLMMRPSCGDREVYMSGLWSEQTGEKFGFDPPFFPCIKHVAGSIKVFDIDSGIRGQSPVLLWGIASLFVFAPELRSWQGILLCLAGFGLQFGHGSPY